MQWHYNDTWLTKHQLTLASGKQLVYWSNDAASANHAAIFLHGNKGTHRVMTALAHEYLQLYPTAQIVLPDLPGFGESDATIGSDTEVLPAHHAALAQLLSHLGNPNYDLVGHSFGAVVAFTYAAEHAADSRLRQLYGFALSVRMAAMPSRILHAYAAIAKWLPISLRNHYLYNRFLNQAENHYFIRTRDQQLRALITADRRQELDYKSPTTLLATFALLYTHDLRQILQRAKVPATIVHGTRDNAASIRFAEQFATDSGAKFVSIAGAGHFLVNEHTGECAKVFRQTDR